MCEFINIPGFEDIYRINGEGDVFSVKRNKILSPRVDSGGYHYVTLCKNGKRKNYMVHKLIQKTFLKKEGHIDHINNIKTDNRLSNLRVVTASQNHMNRKNVKGYQTTIRIDDKGEEVEYYRARIMKNGKNYNKSSYNLQVVLKFRVCMEILLFREFANKINCTKVISS